MDLLDEIDDGPHCGAGCNETCWGECFDDVDYDEQERDLELLMEN